MFIHTVYRLDVNCVIGQTNTCSVVIKGESRTKQYKCFTNSPLEIQPPPQELTIHANSLFEIPLMIKTNEHSDRILLNIVNEELKLKSTYMIYTRLTMPQITKVFEIKLKKGKPALKVLFI